MKKALPRIKSAEPVIHGVLKVVFLDGYEGVVDLRPTIDRGKVFAYLKDPDNFRKLRVEEFGGGPLHSGFKTLGGGAGDAVPSLN